jgi:signal transduction histidine kinase
VRRLHHHIYLGFVAVALACALAAGVTARVLHDGKPPAPPVVVSGMRLLAEEIPADPHARHQRLAELSGRFGAELGLYDSDGGVLAVTSAVLPRPPLEGEPVAWFRSSVGWGLRVQLRDGRWFQGAVRHRQSFDKLARHLAFLGLIAGVVAVGSLPVARRITRRLGSVEDAMRRWGEGDLAVRAPVHGRDEVASLARTWNAAADRVAGLLEKERRVLASASHELRSPLARLRMAVELLDDGGPEQHGWADGARKDVAELDELVGDLLLAARARHAGLPQDAPRVDLRAVVEDEARRQDASFSGGPAEMPGDPRLLRRMVRNLMENARRHGGSAVEVELGPGPELRVLDRGPGVPESEWGRIWEPFYRAQGHREGEDGGVGLGLSLVAEIAAHHGATAGYRPRDGGGSCFFVRWGA